ncbi:hypothetical protein N7532_003106 [Penicillium argentinense]|uniref:Uncharacterized protein n=1 Tax=Penicillium argentinense TaxID=1131581 RepID=A0A9W9FMA6_9EURO|nr:uncharacterized protein N7532_003106 [Penicillium argentinense]KAJ5102577.1 hypothetical protein N7532_003106 [Penicillium argentinense]
MAAPENPFTNLDVSCKWTGDPISDVDVSVSVDVCCTPGTSLVVLDTRYPANSRVKEFSLAPKQELLQLPQIEDVDSPPTSTVHTPTPSPNVSAAYPHQLTTGESLSNPATTVKTDSLPDADTPPIDSDSESVLVQENLHQDGFLGSSVLPDPFYSDLSLEPRGPAQINAGSLNGTSRKRSAKAASLPDSVTDSERGYGGFKADKSSFGSTSTSTRSVNHSRQHSMIPRPRLRPKSVAVQRPSSVDPSKMGLPRDTVPALNVDFRGLGSNSAPPNSKIKENTIPSHRRRALVRHYLRPPATPSKPGRLAREGDRDSSDDTVTDSADLEKLSTVAFAGSPCDYTGITDGSDTVSSPENKSEAGIDPFVQPNTPHIWADENYATNGSDMPRLVYTDGRFHIFTPHGTKSSTYTVKINLSVPLQDGKPGWWQLFVSGLPRLAPDDNGYLYFQIPEDQGFEFRTIHFKRHKVMQGYLMAQMLTPTKLILHLRTCELNFYGYVRDFNVTQAVQAEIGQEIHNAEQSIRLVKYHAVCSLDMVQQDFWAERCGFWIYIHGGPEGAFLCALPRTGFLPPFYTIHLETSGHEVGVTRLEILASRATLDKFAITWEMKVPLSNHKALTWMPRIRANDLLEMEDELREEYVQQGARNMLEVVRADRIREPGSDVDPVPANPQEKIKDIPVPSEIQRSQWTLRRVIRYFIISTFVIICLRIYVRVLDSLRLENQLPQCEVTKPVDVIFQPELLGEDEDEPSHEQNIDHELEVESEKAGNLKVTVVPQADGNPEERFVPVPTTPLRDQVDYFLGWRGPIERF